jgi:hypothetical protein
MMQVSAEARLFWNNEPPGFTAWFRSDPVHACNAGGGPPTRTDIYLLDLQQPELGIKLRGGKDAIEIKGLVAILDNPIRIDGVAVAGEIWSKWPSQALVIDARKTFATRKNRWLRKFSTAEAEPREIPLRPDEQPISDVLPAIGCNIELTHITDPFDREWWTLGFEAFGSLDSIGSSLFRTIELFLQRRGRPPVSGGLPASYPAWIGNYASGKGRG